MKMSVEIDEVLLGVLRPLFVGKRIRANRRRKPRLCTGVAWSSDGEYDAEDRVEFTYEDGTAEAVTIYASVEMFD